MIGEIIETKTGSYVRCGAESKPVSREQDILDLLGYCGEIEFNRLMLDEAHLHPDFFDLSSGLAGAIFLKFSNYHVKAAIVADLDGIKSERFQELIYECNKGNEINFFNGITKAEKWLTS
jgi:hypothetical protein